jgi:Uma2 family endonuclease
MHLIAARPANPFLVYPDSDGKPMADNTKQARWIVVLFGNIAALFRSRGDVFVAADLLWYAVEGFPEVRAAPDVLVVFGRPKEDRGSYRQWEEDDVPVTVAFEVLSLGNTYTEMTDKLLFYEEHGVEEYYVFDPDKNRLEIHIREGDLLRPVRPAHGFTSPRLGIRFDLSGPEMVVYRPDGRLFLSFEELDTEREQAQQRAETAEKQAEQAQRRAEQAEMQLEQAQHQTEEAEKRLERMTELTLKVLQQRATVDEQQELQRLLGSHPSP